MINAGRMRETVRIEQRTAALSSFGEQQATWELFAERRAEIVRSPGREVLNADQRQGRVPTVFKLRWLEGVLPEMRLIHDEKLFDIESAIDPDGLGRELLVTAVEHVEAVP